MQPREKSASLTTTTTPKHPPLRMVIRLIPETSNAHATPVEQRTANIPWPNTTPASENLFVMWASWPIPLTQEDTTNAPDATKPLHAYPVPLDSQTPAQNPKEFICRPHCTICFQAIPKKESDSDQEENTHRREERKPKTEDIDYTPHTPKYISVQDQKEEEERCRRLEYLNDKYGLDYYSSSESDSESEHEYATLV